MITAEKLNSVELDLLKEIGNIGCAHAATAISDLIKKKIDIAVPEIQIRETDALAEFLNKTKEGRNKVAAIYLELIKDFKGSIVFIFSMESAIVLSDILMGREVGTSKEIGESEQSALMEVGNIVVSAYANALGEFLNTTVMLTPPTFTLNMPEEVIKNIQNMVHEEASHAVVFNTQLYEDTNLFKSYFILLPSPEALDHLVNQILKKN